MITAFKKSLTVAIKEGGVLNIDVGINKCCIKHNSKAIYVNNDSHALGLQKVANSEDSDFSVYRYTQPWNQKEYPNQSAFSNPKLCIFIPYIGFQNDQWCDGAILVYYDKRLIANMPMGISGHLTLNKFSSPPPQIAPQHQEQSPLTLGQCLASLTVAIDITLRQIDTNLIIVNTLSSVNLLAIYLVAKALKTSKIRKIDIAVTLVNDDSELQAKWKSFLQQLNLVSSDVSPPFSGVSIGEFTTYIPQDSCEWLISEIDKVAPLFRQFSFPRD